MVLTGFKVLSSSYFFSVVVPNDPVWGWLRRRFHLRPITMLAMYRAFFMYGGCRVFAWFIWSRGVRHAPLDWSWGGPFWVVKAKVPNEGWGTFFANTAIGATGFAFALFIIWQFLGRPLWKRGKELPALVELEGAGV
jgi:hypothetical protein